MTRFICVALWMAFAVGPAIAQQGASPTAGGARGFASTIQGHALSFANIPLADTTIRLRDARNGRVVATQLTGKTGSFAFRPLDPGSYVVEVMSQDQTTVVAASQILNVDPGDVTSAVVKLPFRLSPFAGVLGGGTTPASAAAVMTQAAANGVLLITTPATAAPTCQTQVF